MCAFLRANAAAINANFARVQLAVDAQISARLAVRTAAINALLVAILNVVGARRRFETLLIDSPVVKVLCHFARGARGCRMLFARVDACAVANTCHCRLGIATANTATTTLCSASCFGKKKH